MLIRLGKWRIEKHNKIDKTEYPYEAYILVEALTRQETVNIIKKVKIKNVRK